MATITKKGAPNKSTIGQIGDIYIDSITLREFKCIAIYKTSIDDNIIIEYDWDEIYSNNTEGGSSNDPSIQIAIDEIKYQLDIPETTNTVLDNCYSGLLKINEIGGVTEQDRTTGKQLFDYTQLTYQNHISVDKDGFITFTNNTEYGENPVHAYALPKGNYTAFLEVVQNNNCQLFISKADSDYSKAITSVGNQKISFTDAEVFWICVTGKNGASMKFRIMLNEGTEALPYEKYSGGIPAPNPSYPMEIKAYKGKNLLDCRGFDESTAKVVSIKSIKDAEGNVLYFELSGSNSSGGALLYDLGTVNLKRGESYILSDSNLLTLRDSGGGTVYANANVIYTPTADITAHCKLRIGAGETYTNTKIYPMVRKASIADNTYVPYGLLSIKTYNENYLDMRNAKGGTIAGITVTINSNGSYSYVGKATENNINIWLLGSWESSNPLFTLKSGTYFIKGVNLYHNSKTVFGYGREGLVITFNEDTPISGIRAVSGVADTTYNETHYPIIARSNVAVDWKPHQESSITLSQPIELFSDDVLTPQKINKKYDAVVFDGSDDEVWTIISSWSGEGYSTFQINVSSRDWKYTANRNHILCSHFGSTFRNAINTSNPPADSALVGSAGATFVLTRVTGVMTVDELKAWLKSNPITVVSELATPTTEALPLVDQIALNSLSTYDGTTYVEFDAEIQPTFKAEYPTSKENSYIIESMLTARKNEANQQIISDRISALEASIINNI